MLAIVSVDKKKHRRSEEIARRKERNKTDFLTYIQISKCNLTYNFINLCFLFVVKSCRVSLTTICLFLLQTNILANVGQYGDRSDYKLDSNIARWLHHPVAPQLYHCCCRKEQKTLMRLGFAKKSFFLFFYLRNQIRTSPYPISYVVILIPTFDKLVDKRDWFRALVPEKCTFSKLGQFEVHPGWWLIL